MKSISSISSTFRVLFNILFSFILAFYSVFFFVWHTTEVHFYDFRGNILVYSMILAACFYSLPRLWWSVMVFPRAKNTKYGAWLKNVAIRLASHFRR
jgi:hypothetical protein